MRVSTKEQELASRMELLKHTGAEKIFSEKFAGTKRERPIFYKLLQKIVEGDELIVTKLDRFSRSVQQETTLLQELQARGIIANILNMGKIDSSPKGTLMLNMYLSFTQFERDTIVQRTQEGKEYQRRNNPDYREGRKPKKIPAQIKEILEYLETHTYTETTKLFEIDCSTITRYKKGMNYWEISESDVSQVDSKLISDELTGEDDVKSHVEITILSSIIINHFTKLEKIETLLYEVSTFLVLLYRLKFTLLKAIILGKSIT